jgi:hypothetical protein
MVTGMLLVFVCGALIPYNQVALVAVFISSLSLGLILFFVPESPTWLHRKGRTGDAEVAQQRLGIKQPILQNRATKKAAPDKFSRRHDLIYYLGKIRRQEVHKPLTITIAFLFFSQCSGSNCLQSYTVDVITVHPLEMNPYALSVVCGVLQVVGGILLALVLPYSGVKTLSVLSFLGASAGFFALAFSLLFEDSTTPNTFNYIHVISIWEIMIAANVGLLAIPYGVIGEMFPMGAKGFASLSLFASSVFNFIVLKVFPYLFVHYREVVFFGFGVVCACGAAFVTICLPETVGKTMDEIRNSFKALNGRGVSSL